MAAAGVDEEDPLELPPPELPLSSMEDFPSGLQPTCKNSNAEKSKILFTAGNSIFAIRFAISTILSELPDFYKQKIFMITLELQR